MISDEKNQAREYIKLDAIHYVLYFRAHEQRAAHARRELVP